MKKVKKEDEQEEHGVRNENERVMKSEGIIRVATIKFDGVKRRCFVFSGI